MNNGYVFLTEKDEMWAKLLMQVLEDNSIPCTAITVYGAGFTIKTGHRERLKVYVPFECLPTATELLQELFSAEIGQEKE